MRTITIKILALTMLAGAGLGFAAHAKPREDAKRHVGVALAAIALPAYERQRVVYQMNEGAGWFGHGFQGLVHSLENHVAAVGDGNIDVRVILQGKGLDLLRAPDASMRARIDALRAQGVRFMVCRNSLIESATEFSSLYGVQTKDVVRAGVAEIAMLEAKGFVYLRP